MSGLPDVADLRRLVHAFATTAPVPAGGAAAALSIALGAALGIKVRAISGRSDGGTAPERGTIDELLALAAADCAAFTAVLDARRAGDEARTAAAWERAATVPIDVVRAAGRVVATLDAAAVDCKPALRADLDAARALVAAGIAISVTNARDNLTRVAPGVAARLDAALAAAQSPPDGGARQSR